MHTDERGAVKYYFVYYFVKGVPPPRPIPPQQKIICQKKLSGIGRYSIKYYLTAFIGVKNGYFTVRLTD